MINFSQYFYLNEKFENFFQFVMCKLIDKVYSKIAPTVIYKHPTLWTEFEINLMKSACSIDHRSCLTAVFNFVREMLQNESSNSYVSSKVTANICTFNTEYVIVHFWDLFDMRALRVNINWKSKSQNYIWLNIQWKYEQ